ncbi:hypothetical protein SCUCBS95973_000732 [Sporothrix curviconia]|uniref:30S ribosomal protein S20 n=1 Tax=Sporothrix curviconia TaxID=1260050 RepID=A0ABP0ASS3_9PEZI
MARERQEDIRACERAQEGHAPSAPYTAAAKAAVKRGRAARIFRGSREKAATKAAEILYQEYHAPKFISALREVEDLARMMVENNADVTAETENGAKMARKIAADFAKLKKPEPEVV